MRFSFGLAAVVLVGACSGNSPSGDQGTPNGAAGASTGGTGGAPTSAGTSSSTAGSTSGGTSMSAGAATGGNAGSSASAGQGGAVAQGGAGGVSTQGGSSAGTAGSAGAAGSSSAGPFTCNQVTAMTLTKEWFQAGFEADAGIVNARWQLKAREHGYIVEWANPNSDFWNEAPQSACAAGSTNPDHVVLTVLSWNPACCTTQPQWEQQVEGAVTTLVAKYSALKRIDLMTVVRGPGNADCPTPPAANETLAMPPELDAALAAVAAKHTGLVFVAPKFEAPNCAAFSGGGPHLTTAGNTAVAKDIAAHFATLQ